MSQFVLFVRKHQRVLMVSMLVFMLAAIAAPSFAQTPVPLNIPINEIFSQTNNWMTTFAPVVTIGIAIALAIAILTMIGDRILKGIRGGSTR